MKTFSFQMYIIYLAEQRKEKGKDNLADERIPTQGSLSRVLRPMSVQSGHVLQCPIQNARSGRSYWAQENSLSERQ